MSEYSGGTNCRDVSEMTLDWYWYCTSPVMGLWEITTCMDPKELWYLGPQGILTGESMSSRGESDPFAHDPVNPGGAGSNCLHMMANPPELSVPSGSEASGLSGVCAADDSSSQDSDLSGGPSLLHRF